MDRVCGGGGADKYCARWFLFVLFVLDVRVPTTTIKTKRRKRGTTQRDVVRRILVGDSGSVELWWVGAGLYRCVGERKREGRIALPNANMIEAKHNDRCIKVANMAQWGEIHGRVLWGCMCVRVCGGACCG